MTDYLAQTVLEFARECLGWERASPAHSPDGVIWNGQSRESMAGFHFTHLNAVMDAVRGWCDENDTAIEIGYYGYIPGEWEVQAVTPVSSEPIQSADLCYALLAACVQAARKLRA